MQTPGDANCDAQIDESDLSDLISVLFGTESDCPNVDPDGDLRITAADLVAILLLRELPPPSSHTPSGTPTPTSTLTPTLTATASASPALIPTTAPSPSPTPTPGASFTPTQKIPSIADVQGAVFDAGNQGPLARCSRVGCHSAGSQAAGLSLAAGQSLGELVGVEPTTFSARTRGLLRVAPGDLDRSFLWLKVTGNLQAGDGSRMPLGGPVLAQEKLDLLRDWILAGAPG